MMNKEFLYRIKTAGEYQKKAVRALFPEKMSEHLDVIEKEIKMMFVESVADMMKACDGRDACGTVKNHEQTEKVKKVDIA